MYVRALLTAASVVALGASFASAQSAPPAPPYASFQWATLTGTTNTVSIALVPVVNASGNVALENLTLTFGFDASGNLVVSNLQAAAAPLPIIAGFKAGAYLGPSTIHADMYLVVAGPGLAAGGATEWALGTVPASTGFTYPASATWYSGPLTSNPLYSRISAAKITSTAWSYGVGGGPESHNEVWQDNSLLGFSQVGNSITIVTFTDSSGVDHSEPQDQVTYQLAG